MASAGLEIGQRFAMALGAPVGWREQIPALK